MPYPTKRNKPVSNDKPEAKRDNDMTTLVAEVIEAAKHEATNHCEPDGRPCDCWLCVTVKNLEATPSPTRETATTAEEIVQAVSNLRHEPDYVRAGMYATEEATEMVRRALAARPTPTASETAEEIEEDDFLDWIRDQVPGPTQSQTGWAAAAWAEATRRLEGNANETFLQWSPEPAKHTDYHSIWRMQRVAWRTCYRTCHRELRRALAAGEEKAGGWYMRAYKAEQDRDRLLQRVEELEKQHGGD